MFSKEFYLGGGVLLESEVASSKLPFFVGYFEDSHFYAGSSFVLFILKIFLVTVDYLSGHYQSIVPFEDGDILKTIRDAGGCDVRARLRLEYSGQFYFDIVLLHSKCLS